MRTYTRNDVLQLTGFGKSKLYAVQCNPEFQFPESWRVKHEAGRGHFLVWDADEIDAWIEEFSPETITAKRPEPVKQYKPREAEFNVMPVTALHNLYDVNGIRDLLLSFSNVTPASYKHYPCRSFSTTYGWVEQRRR